MTKKKILSVVLAIAICFTMVAGSLSALADTPAIPTASYSIAFSGSQATVTISGTDLFVALLKLDIGDLTVTNVAPVDPLALKVETNSLRGEGGVPTYVFTDGKLNVLADTVDNSATLTNMSFVITFDLTKTHETTSISVLDIDAASDDESGATTEGMEGNINVQPDTSSGFDPENIVIQPEETCDHDGTGRTYSDNGDGTHDVICEECNEVVDEDVAHVSATRTLTNVTDTNFVYTHTCADCGATYEELVPIGTPIDNVRIGNNIKPMNDISINFFSQTDDIKGYKDFCAVVKKQIYDNNSTNFHYEYSYNTNTDTTLSSGCTGFNITGVAAYEMSNIVSADFYANVNGEMVRLGSKDYSVVTYCTSQLSKASDAKFKKVLVDLLNYGAAAQAHAKYNVANLANASLTDAQKALGTTTYPTTAAECNALSNEVTTTKIINNTTAAGTIKVGTNLNPGSKIDTQFMLGDYNGDLNNYYCVFDYYENTTSGPVIVSATQSYAKDGLMTSYPLFRFDLAPVFFADYPIKATIYYGDPENGGVAIAEKTYSVETYISKNINSSTETLRNVLKCMFALSNSLAAYVNIVPYVG